MENVKCFLFLFTLHGFRSSVSNKLIITAVTPYLLHGWDGLSARLLVYLEVDNLIQGWFFYFFTGLDRNGSYSGSLI